MSFLNQSFDLLNLRSSDSYGYKSDYCIGNHYKTSGEFFKNFKSNILTSNINKNSFSKNLRKDKFGKEISRKTKEHKISFADQFEKPEREFVEIYFVQSLRELYNITRVNVEGKQCFGCSIF